MTDAIDEIKRIHAGGGQRITQESLGDDIQRYNAYHDEKGRFTQAEGAASVNISHPSAKAQVEKDRAAGRKIGEKFEPKNDKGTGTNYFETLSSQAYKDMSPNQKRDELKYLIGRHDNKIYQALGREQTESRKKRVETWRKEITSMKTALKNMSDKDFNDQKGTRFNINPSARIDHYIEYGNGLRANGGKWIHVK